MKRPGPAGLLVALTCALSLCGAPRFAGAADSGFLPDYSKLVNVKDALGRPIRRWISPTFNKTNYQKVLIEPVTFYPAAKGSEQVSDQVLGEMQQYLDSQLRSVGLAGIPQTATPGPGVARVQVAITAADTRATDLKPWQLIPAALVIQGARAATGTRPVSANLAVEGMITDSVSNEPLAMAVRETHGVTVPDSRTQVTLATVTPSIDAWAQAVAVMVALRTQ
jgi:hypothetical protein